MENQKYLIKKIMKLFNLLKKNNRFVIKLLLPMLVMNKNALFLDRIKNNNNKRSKKNKYNNNCQNSKKNNNQFLL